MKYYEIGAIVLGMVGSTVQAEPVQWSMADGGNGHWYEQINTGSNLITWQDAFDIAESMGGHLVTITSQEEDSFVHSSFSCNTGWAGGTRENGEWNWITGEVWDYTNWHPGEPNGGDGYHLEVYFKCTAWNDMHASYQRDSLIVEWEPIPLVQWQIEDGGNGHWYQGVTAWGGISWLEANAAAAEMGGYLATLTSADEDQFVCFTIAEPEELWVMKGTPRGPWLGGQRTEEDCDLQAMNWITGEPWNYTRWHSGNPNDDCTSGLQLWDYGVRDWQDNHDDDPTRANGYIVEFTTLPGSASGACCLDGLCITTAAADCSGNSGSWGGPDSSCADFDCPESCPSDVDGDGDVGVSDILILIAAWGACP
ncbi:MAG: hypothetical protein HOJ00_04455 [Phycisphaerae bacterium]|nr:hypothetical protein [Phycisphaerae bacterium]